MTALIFASQNGHEPVVEQLLAAHPDVNAQNKVRGPGNQAPTRDHDEDDSRTTPDTCLHLPPLLTGWGVGLDDGC